MPGRPSRQQNRLRPIMDGVHPLEAAAAMARMEAGEQFGEIVLKAE